MDAASWCSCGGVGPAHQHIQGHVALDPPCPEVAHHLWEFLHSKVGSTATTRRKSSASKKYRSAEQVSLCTKPHPKSHFNRTHTQHTVRQGSTALPSAVTQVSAPSPLHSSCSCWSYSCAAPLLTTPPSTAADPANQNRPPLRPENMLQDLGPSVAANNMTGQLLRAVFDPPAKTSSSLA
jgi:hypothetical protein